MPATFVRGHGRTPGLPARRPTPKATITAPTNAVLDDFNRANANPISGNWATLTPVGSPLQLLSNQAKSSLGDSASYWNASQFGPDMEAFIDIVTPPTASGIDIYLRVQNPTSTTTDVGYDCNYNSINHTVTVSKMSGATWAQIGGSASVTFAAGDSMWASVIGPTIRIYRKPSGGDWQLLLTVVDPSPITGTGFLAVECADTTSVFDNFGGGNLPAVISIVNINTSDSFSATDNAASISATVTSAGDSGSATEGASTINIPTSDSATESEGTSAIGQSTSDSGSATEGGSIINIPTSDTFSTTDNPATISATLSSAGDSGSGSEGTCNINVPTSDNFSESDASQLVTVLLISTTDSATGSEGSSLIGITTTDAGTSTDANAGIGVSTTDSGSALEGTTNIGQSTSDSGSGSEGTTNIGQTRTDSGTGTDNPSSISATVSSAGDAATASDASSSTLSFQRSDAFSANDLSSISSTASANDSASFTDVSAFAVVLNVFDSATGSDASQPIKFGFNRADTAGLAENASSIIAIGSTTEAVTASDVSGITVVFTANDVFFESETSSVFATAARFDFPPGHGEIDFGGGFVSGRPIGSIKKNVSGSGTVSGRPRGRIAR